MTDDGLLDPGRLQQAFAFGSPVLVLGPGCHRIGYDRETSPEWNRVRQRVASLWARLGEGSHRRFLEQMWVSKLSEETRDHWSEYLENLPVDETLEFPGYKLSDPADHVGVDPVRTALALPLLRALGALTRCLGTVIATGEAPVTEWQRVEVPPAARFGNGQDGTASAGAEIEAAQQLAKTLAKRCAGTGAWSSTDDKTLKVHGVAGQTKATLAAENFALLKIDAISASLLELHERHFQKGAAPLTGAVIEWLSDLVWHVLVSGAGVSPSQDELAFAVNLTRRQRHPISFSRPQPGDFRRAESERQAAGEEIAALLKHCDSGRDIPDWKLPRPRFFATLAAMVVQKWHDEVKGIRRGRSRLVLVLVADYDLMFERAVMTVLKPGEAFHVVMPIWVGEEDPALDWVIGTFRRPNVDSADMEEADLTQTEEWKWLHQAEQHAAGAIEGAIEGPIVIKLNGSPLHEWGAKEPTIEGVGLSPENEYGDAYVQPAAIYSEHDSLQSIVSLGNTIARGKGKLPEELFSAYGLTWLGRSWLFFGHRFSDWLPRLRLFFMANSDPGDKPARKGLVVEKIAVDRAFGWPEIALLSALDVTPFHGDLALISELPAEVDTPEAQKHAEITMFLNSVTKLRARATRAAGRA